MAAATLRLQGGAASARSSRVTRAISAPERACVLSEESLDYFALPVFDEPTLYPADPDFRSVVHSTNPLPRGLSPGPGGLAEAVAMLPNGRTADAMSLVYATGRSSEFGPWVVTGTARAIIGSTLYAFRHCLSGCAPYDARPHEEVLVVVGPDAEWTSSSSDDGWRNLQPGSLGSFSFASATVSPGSSASLGFVVTLGALELFGAKDPPEIASAPALPGNLSRFATFSLDVVWPRDGAPELTLHRGALVVIDRGPPPVESNE
jgi:hypothetical protein